MTQIYIKENGKKVTIEVSDEVAVAIEETRRDIWKSEAKAQYHNTSLDGIEEDGAIFASEELSPLDEYIEREDKKNESLALRQAISTLAP
ncbi:MAG: hypothetical protein RR327_08870, partial [Clostridia bacterium]